MTLSSENAGVRLAAAGAPPPRALVMLLFVSLFWGLNWPAMKIVLGQVEPWTFRAVCLAVGIVALWLFAKLSGSGLRISREELGPLLLGGLLNTTGWHLLTAYALTLMDAGRAGIIGFTMPLWASVLGWLILRERMRPAAIGGLALGLAGMALLARPLWDSLGGNLTGPALMIGAAVSWAGGLIVLKGTRWRLSAVAVTFWQLVFGGLPILALTPFLGTPSTLALLDGRSAAALVFVLTLPILYCQLAWVKLVRLLPANVAAVGTLLIPVVGVFSSALLVGERVGWAEVAALASVVAGLVLVMVVPGRRA